jgi:hypothetical protein
MDDVGLPVADRDAFGRVLERHGHVRRILAGHVHRPISGDVGGREIVVAPSIYVAARLDFHSEEITLTDEPPGFAIHTLLDGQPVSHVMRVS